ncbi:MAG: polysaccharide deacetylase family protein [Eubacteriales bacterium]
MKAPLQLIAALTAAGIAAAQISGVGFIEKFKEILPDSSENSETEVENEDFTPKRGKNSPCRKKNESASGNVNGAVSVSSAPQNWYCKHMKSSARPPIPPEMSWVRDHNGYFLGEDEKVIYLTFDAGYENGNVEKILDTLKSENVPAAFFILDNLVESNNDLVKRMIDEGHTICNHTAKHRDMTKVTTKEAFAEELQKMEQIYKDKTGAELSKYYRPPEGKFNEDNLVWADELGYKTIFWSFAYADWDNENQMSAESAINKIITNTHNGEVLLLHPTSKTNAEILPELIRQWREMGYGFGTLDELTESGC